jgi:type VI secretion system secreted protein VgrG
MAYTQDNRIAKVDTDLGKDVLLLKELHGIEGVSMPFVYRLDLLSENAKIDARKLLRSKVTLTVKVDENTKERKIHGIIRRFVQLGQDKDLTLYHAEVVPWLWFLSLSRDCKIFQSMTVPEILQKVFKDQGYSDFKMQVKSGYPKREYCVQYRETHLDFVSRLMEEEGIFYFFEHTGTQHTLVLTDSNSDVKPCPVIAKVRMAHSTVEDEDVVQSLVQEHAVHIGKVSLSDYNYLEPGLTLRTTAPAQEKGEEVYDYPGSYTAMDGGERYAKLQVVAEEALRHVARGEAACRTFQSGFRFQLDEHYRADANQEYMLLQVQHKIKVSDYRSEDTSADHYSNAFLAIPYQTPYRPQRRTPRPVVRGNQPALVVGKAGEEIWTDKHGRVKVQFYWDRDGKKDENSSCWVRVSSSWAGKGWGAVQIPRIGQEVIVDFVEGNPDLPIITGRVYNGVQVPPYKLPDNQTQSGVLSRSSKNGTSENANQLRFEDNKDKEQVYLHAERDFDTVVENNETHKVGFEKQKDGDQTIEVFNNRKLVVGGGKAKAKEGSETTEVWNNQVVKVGTGKAQAKDGSHTMEVFKNQTLKVGTPASNGSQTVEVYKDQSVTLKTGNQKLDIKMGNQTVELGMGNQNVTLKMGNRSVKLSLGKSTEEALQSIELKVGQSSLKVDQMGVTIKGMMVKIEGQVMTEVKGMMTQINGSAMLIAKGGLTMIN